ncbi:TetR/AcrR family transcriptional regulator [Ascidiimonas sp. W6]|uniref:TetR/AcrR family transcriptional regulator n=1 Tax=Ascidiimonas meishanensis TaxID=3128903 RepID=UPI0030EC32DF
MSTKAERTSTYIIETVAPIFNRKGYAATSLSDLTEATGLTKGAIYGNFKNKEELAILAFNYNIEKLLTKITNRLEATSSPLQKLFVLTNFYRFYADYTKDFGGCPVLNVGVDTKNQNVHLQERVQLVVVKLQKIIEDIITEGKVKAEIKPYINSERYSRQLFTMIEGAVFSATIMENTSYLKEMMDVIDKLIITQLKI